MTEEIHPSHETDRSYFTTGERALYPAHNNAQVIITEVSENSGGPTGPVFRYKINEDGEISDWIPASYLRKI